MVDNKFRVEQLNTPPKPQENPNLISKKSMSAYASTATKSNRATYHEILTRINNAKESVSRLDFSVLWAQRGGNPEANRYNHSKLIE